MHLSKSVIALALLGASSLASAGTYMGISLGESSIEYKRPNFNNNFDPEDLDIEDSDLGFKVFGGYKFTLAAVELAYVDFGRIEDNDSYAEVSGVSAFGMLHFGLGPIGVFGKAGGFAWSSDVVSGIRAAVEEKEQDDGYDLAYGLGIKAGLFGINGRLEYEYFNVGSVEDISMVSVGVSYSF